MKFKLVLSCFLLLPYLVKSQTSPQLSASEIKLGLQKLNVVGSVLYIAAHPDDENTRLLSYLVSDRKLRTGYLSLTRGDGGQNLIGTEQVEQLGLIRTQELLAARRIDGAEQFFTRANDFGFSKTSDETFKLWNKDRILSDVVWVIRKFQPDVIITRFPGDARAGHGHHAASSILAQEAFIAAADASRFPEQLTVVKPWKTKRIYWNTFNFGNGINTTSEDQIKINVGTYNALLGKGYGEIASESRSQHKSQGFGVAKQRGESFEYFSLLNGEAAKNDILDGIDLSWNRISDTKEIQGLIQKINKDYELESPQKSVTDLVKLYSLIKNLKDSTLRNRKLKDVSNLILASAAIWVEAYSTEPSVAIKQDVKLKIQAISRYSQDALLSISSQGKSLSQNLSLSENQLKTIESSVKAEKITQPYWLNEKHPIGEYIVSKRDDIGFPENPDKLTLHFTLNLLGEQIEFDRAVVYKFTDPIRGEVYSNTEITPPVIAIIQQSQLIFPNNNSQTLSIKLKALKENALGSLNLKLPAGWKSEPAVVNFNIKNKGDEQSVALKVSPGFSANSGKLKVELNLEKEIFTKSLTAIQYNHIPTITYFPEAEADLVKLDLKTNGKKIAYIPGAGDLVPNALKQVGYEVNILNENQINNTDLSQFEAIITGVRLYNVEPRMKFINEKLLKYVEDGGVMLVQYNVNQPLVTNNIGPYPFTVTRDRVTEEDAKVTILNPAHRLLNYPNKITEKDFEGWVQERGVYYLSNVDEKYEPLLSMKDTNEKEQTGSLIVTNYGKGRFIYTGLSFFRQLPAAVPGAYRLFINLTSK